MVERRARRLRSVRQQGADTGSAAASCTPPHRHLHPSLRRARDAPLAWVLRTMWRRARTARRTVRACPCSLRDTADPDAATWLGLRSPEALRRLCISSSSIGEPWQRAVWLMTRRNAVLVGGCGGEKEKGKQKWGEDEDTHQQRERERAGQGVV